MKEKAVVHRSFFAALALALLIACEPSADIVTDTADTGDTGAAVGCVEVPNYPDADADGWGCQVPGEVSAALWACNPPPGYAAQLGDCDDADPSVNYGAADPIGDGLDTDCDGTDG